MCSMVWALLTSSGRPYHTRHPEYLILCLKYSVLGMGGIKQPALADLRLILLFHCPMCIQGTQRDDEMLF